MLLNFLCLSIFWIQNTFGSTIVSGNECPAYILDGEGLQKDVAQCSAADYRTKILPGCIPKGCKPGNPAMVSGDPHIVMWNGAKHSFMGATDGFYYLIEPCKFKHITNTEMPFNLIAKMHIVEGSFTTVEYTILEVFGSDKRYYIYIRGSHALLYVDSNTQRNIKLMKDASLSLITPGSETLLGQAGRILYLVKMVDGVKEATIKLKIPGIACQWALELTSYAQASNDKGIPIENSVTVQVPKCYKCGICGLFGDFYNTGTNLYRPTLGGVVNIDTGNWDPTKENTNLYNHNAWDDAKFDAVVKATTYVANKNPAKVTVCSTNAQIWRDVFAECNAAFSAYKTKHVGCCDVFNKDICDETLKNCFTDTCYCISKPTKPTPKSCATNIIRTAMPGVCTGHESEKDIAAHTNNLNVAKTSVNVVKSVNRKEFIIIVSVMVFVGMLIGAAIIACCAYFCCIKPYQTPKNGRWAFDDESE